MVYVLERLNAWFAIVSSARTTGCPIQVVGGPFSHGLQLRCAVPGCTIQWTV